MFFPKEIFKHILEYCDDRVERDQKRIWDQITVGMYLDYDECEKPHKRGDIWADLGGFQERISWKWEETQIVITMGYYHLRSDPNDIPLLLTKSQKLAIQRRLLKTSRWEEHLAREIAVKKYLKEDLDY